MVDLVPCASFTTFSHYFSNGTTSSNWHLMKFWKDFQLEDHYYHRLKWVITMCTVNDAALCPSSLKIEYESVIDAIVQKKRNATRFEQNQLTRFTEEGTIRYSNHICMFISCSLDINLQKLSTLYQ